MTRLMKSAFALLLLLLAPVGIARAQQAEPRTLEVPANAGWQHAATGMILRSNVAGLRRGEIRDSTAGELDVVASYTNETEGITATVYLYRSMTPDAALWFDRALFAIAAQPVYGIDPGALPVPTAFTRPRATVASGLIAAMDVRASGFSSTALALVPVGPFLVKVRMSAAHLDRAALLARLNLFIEGLGWPEPNAADRAANMMTPCPTPLTYRRARVIRAEGANVLLDLVGAAAVANHQNEGPPPDYCRDPGATTQYGVYRQRGTTDSYLLALSDAGITLSVGSAIDLSALGLGGGGQRRYAMLLQDRTSTGALPSFNRLPSPDQAISVAFGPRAEPTISISSEPDR